ncbi:MAG: helix-turn-helix transcriptional regulator [Clostridia bacterium]|nr:helix-turn-helix transcriptional regulator [Clostridia bacterium]
MIQNTLTEGDRPRKPYDHRIFLILSGSASFILNGNEIPIFENSLIFLGINDEYFFKGKVRAVVINFDMTMAFCAKKQCICPVPRDIYDDELTFDKTTVESLEEPIIITADATMRSDTLALVQTYISGTTFSETLCSAMMKKLLADILLSLNKPKDKQTLLVDRILLYIRDNATDIDSNAYLGKIFGYHPVYLAEIFKNGTGKTLHSVILEEKLRIAARWLTYSNEAIEQIAFEIGFSSRNHFCTAFKKQFGCSPLSYRKRATISTI